MVTRPISGDRRPGPCRHRPRTHASAAGSHAAAHARPHPAAARRRFIRQLDAAFLGARLHLRVVLGADLLALLLRLRGAHPRAVFVALLLRHELRAVDVAVAELFLCLQAIPIARAVLILGLQLIPIADPVPVLCMCASDGQHGDGAQCEQCPWCVHGMLLRIGFAWKLDY